MTGFCIALFYASCLQVLWGDKPVIEFSENAVAYTNFRKMTNIPYVEITGITLNKYVSTRNGTITTLSIERANSGIRRINLDYLDRSAYEIMSQLNQKLPPKMVDFSQLD